MKRLLPALLLVLLMAGPAAAEQMRLGAFSQGDLTGWEPKQFKGATEYQIVSEDGRRVLRARARASASGLFKEVGLDPKRWRILSWSWKISGTLPKGDARQKAGDDYPARVYVVFQATLPWNTRGITYIWANKLPQGQAVPNPFSSQVKLVAVRSGEARAGQWLSEQRDVYRDFLEFFGEPPPAIGAIAVMTDADNTGGQAEAFYGDIFISTAP